MDSNLILDKKILCILVKFEILEQFFYQKKIFLDQILNHFKNLYFIDISFLYGSKKKYDLKKFKKKNFIFISPKTTEDFINFSNNKKITAIINTGRSWDSLKLFFLLRKVNYNLIQISNIGNAQGTEYKNYKSFLKQNISKTLPHKLYLFFSFFNVIPKIDIKFVSNKKYYNSFRNNSFLKKGMNIFTTKKIILVNSLAYDELLISKNKINKKYIVMLNTNINHKDAIKFSGRLSKKKVFESNLKLKIFLQNISKEFKKKVVICLHPSSDLNKEKKFFNNFKVVKFQTKKFIKQAWLVFLYETSSVVDAIILNKKIINLENSAMGQNWINQSNQYPKKIGISKLNIDKEDNEKFKNLILKVVKKKNNPIKYNNFVKNNLCADKKNIMGSTKILKIIKKLYF